MVRKKCKLRKTALHLHLFNPACSSAMLTAATTFRGRLCYTSASFRTFCMFFFTMRNDKRAQKKEHNCHNYTRGSLYGDQCPSQWEM